MDFYKCKSMLFNKSKANLNVYSLFLVEYVSVFILVAFILRSLIEFLFCFIAT